jgi:hypothetical protein
VFRPFFIKEILDEYIRRNFQTLQDKAISNPLLGGRWATFEKTFEGPEAGYDIIHSLGVAPKHVFITWVSKGTATLHYGAVTEKAINITVTSDCVVRGIVGG